MQESHKQASLKLNESFKGELSGNYFAFTRVTILMSAGALKELLHSILFFYSSATHLYPSGNECSNRRGIHAFARASGLYIPLYTYLKCWKVLKKKERKKYNLRIQVLGSYMLGIEAF